MFTPLIDVYVHDVRIIYANSQETGGAYAPQAPPLKLPVLRPPKCLTHSLMFACTFTPADVDLQRKLLDPSHASCELDEDTLQRLIDAIGDKWATIAPLLSFTTAEIEQIRSEDCPAQAMLLRLKDKRTLTHEQLCSHLRTVSLLSPTI